jgi:hypothetical protein
MTRNVHSSLPNASNTVSEFPSDGQIYSLYGRNRASAGEVSPDGVRACSGG